VIATRVANTTWLGSTSGKGTDISAQTSPEARPAYTPQLDMSHCQLSLAGALSATRFRSDRTGRLRPAPPAPAPAAPDLNAGESQAISTGAFSRFDCEIRVTPPRGRLAIHGFLLLSSCWAVCRLAIMIRVGAAVAAAGGLAGLPGSPRKGRDEAGEARRNKLGAPAW